MDQIEGDDARLYVPLRWVLRRVGCRCKLALRRHHLWLHLVRTSRAVGLGWRLLILLLVLLGLIWVPVGGLEGGCGEIWEAGVCGGGVTDKGIVGQTVLWTRRVILVHVHGRGQEMIIVPVVIIHTGLCNY